MTGCTEQVGAARLCETMDKVNAAALFDNACCGSVHNANITDWQSAATKVYYTLVHKLFNALGAVATDKSGALSHHH
jgi:hypothetical protein